VQNHVQLANQAKKSSPAFAGCGLKTVAHQKATRKEANQLFSKANSIKLELDKVYMWDFVGEGFGAETDEEEYMRESKWVPFWNNMANA
jgi:hypothetical protein